MTWRRTRLAALAPLALSTASASPPPAILPDAVEAGRVAATLSDWQTITYFLIFLLVVSTGERIISKWQDRTTARLSADALDRLAQAVTGSTTDLRVTLALIQEALRRLEAQGR